MTTTAVCPICEAPQGEGIACHSCTSRLERDLGDVAAIVADLDVTLSKQDRLGESGKGAPARERTPIKWAATDPRWVLLNVLGTWARDVSGERWSPASHLSDATSAAARYLLNSIPQIRRHPAVVELVDEITDAIQLARRTVDRPADKQYLGQCLVPTPDEEGRDVTCLEDVYASPTARFAVCKVCGVTHDVMERRASLLAQAEDRLFTTQEAAQIIGSYGDLLISESTIRSYVSTGQISYHGKADGKSLILMGDLMKAIARHAAKPKGRKLKRAS